MRESRKLAEEFVGADDRREIAAVATYILDITKGLRVLVQRSSLKELGHLNYLLAMAQREASNLISDFRD